MKKENNIGSNEFNSRSSACENALLPPENINNMNGPVFASDLESHNKSGSNEFNLKSSAYENKALPQNDKKRK